MNIYEIIYAVREGLKEYTDDTRYVNDYLMYLVKIKRAAYIRREYSVIQRLIDNEITQTICMPLELIENDSECPDCGFSVDDCEVVRTINKLPYTVEISNRNLITRIAPIGVMKNKFELITRERAIYAGEGEYEKNTVYVFPHSNGHLYLKSKKNFYKSLEAISVTAVLEDPVEATSFKGCGGPDSPCYTLDKDRYPIKNWMVDIIIKEIIAELINLKRVPEDKENDSKAAVQ